MDNGVFPDLSACPKKLSRQFLSCRSFFPPKNMAVPRVFEDVLDNDLPEIFNRKRKYCKENRI